MQFPKQLMVSLGKLKPAPWNPPRRTSDARMKALIKSMDSWGQKQPILITSGNLIIEGHRRVAAAKSLGWDTIWAVVDNEGADSSAKEVYASINGATARHNGNDKLGIWLAEPMALPKLTRGRHECAAEYVGKPTLQKLYDAGLSIRFVDVAVNVCRMCDCETNEKIKLIVNWMLNHQMAGRVWRYIAGGQDPRLIMRAAEKNKPIALKVAIG